MRELLRRPSAWVLLGAALSAYLSIYAMTQPHALTGVHGYTGQGYDDGVYYGAAVQIAHGVLPYRDFALLHPPGVPLLLTPIALVGRLIGQQHGLVAARLLTLIIATANPVLAGVLVRHRGRAAVVVASLGLAAYPATLASTATVLLEPYLAVFVLLAAVLAFDRGRLVDGPRLLWAGVAMGVAASMREEAVIPAAVLLACCIARRRWRRPLLGVVLGFGVTVLPLAVLAPRDAWRDIVSSQLGRHSTGELELTTSARFASILGVDQLTSWRLTGGQAVGLAALIGLLVLGALLLRRTQLLEVFLAVSVALYTVSLLVTSELYAHYAYPDVALLAPLLGASIGIWARRVPGWPRFAREVALVAAVALVLGAVPQLQAHARTYLADSDAPEALVRAFVPVGACTLSEQPTVLLVADRLSPATAGCPPAVDPFGLWLVDNDGRPPQLGAPTEAAFPERWQGWFAAADDVVLTIPFSNYIPWTPALRAWFTGHYRLVTSAARTYVYVQVGHSDPTVGKLLRGGRTDVLRALQREPTNPAAFTKLGDLETDPATAVTDYVSALHAAPDYAPAACGLAAAELATKAPDAVASYQQCVQLNPSDPATNLALGGLLLSRGDASGQTYIDQALLLDPH